jgi:hypothetical protein
MNFLNEWIILMDENKNENKMNELFKWKLARNIFFVKKWKKNTRWKKKFMLIYFE